MPACLIRALTRYAERPHLCCAPVARATCNPSETGGYARFMLPGPVRREGVVATWNLDRGFGFATPVSGGPDVFVHISELPANSLPPAPGDRLTFETQISDRGKPRAKRAEIIGRRDPASALRTAVTAPWQRSTAVTERPFIGYLAIAAFAVLYIAVTIDWDLPWWVGAIYLGASAASYIAYALDKAAAQGGRWRISESSLIALSVVGGWPGSIIAQQRLRHKTRKRRFRIAFWGSVGLNIAAFVTLASPAVRDLFANAAQFYLR